jgi:maltose-binding protein MalE
VSGPTYTNADAVADWTSVAGTTTAAPYQPAAGVAGSGVPGTVAYTQFKDGRFTTWNGTKGTFDGKWTLNSFEATVDGTSATSVVTSPGYLWSSTPGYANDSFGVWLRAL